VGGGFVQREGERAVLSANGCARGDVGVVREGDVAGLPSAEAWERGGCEREGSSTCVCDGFGRVGHGLVPSFGQAEQGHAA
jgi:hypothetical protein